MKKFPVEYDKKSADHKILLDKIVTMHKQGNTYSTIAKALTDDGWVSATNKSIQNAAVSRFALGGGHRTLTAGRRRSHSLRVKKEESIVTRLTDVLSSNLGDDTKEALIKLMVRG